MSDLISRQAAIAALNEYFARIEKLKRRGLTKGEKAISLDTVGAIKTLPPANCSEFPNNSDTISRQAAIDALRGYLVGKRCPDDGTLTCRLIENEVINKLPTAQPDIIYCGECTKMKVDSIFHDCWCSETGKKVWINHYCGYAERRKVTI